MASIFKEGRKKGVSFERGNVHRAYRDVWARHIEKKAPGVKEPYAVATAMAKKGYKPRKHKGEIKAEFKEQKAAAK